MDSSHIDDEPDEPGDVLASDAEVDAEVMATSRDAMLRRRLVKGASFLLSRTSKLQGTCTEEDLLQTALTAILERRRKWKKNRVDFIGLVFGVMKSLASNADRILAKTTVETVSESVLAGDGLGELASPLANIAGDGPTPQEAYSAKEEQAELDAAVASLRAQIEPNDPALHIFDLLLAGKSKKEIREQLGLSSNEFWSADRRLSRHVDAFATKRGTE